VDVDRLIDLDNQDASSFHSFRAFGNVKPVSSATESPSVHESDFTLTPTESPFDEWTAIPSEEPSESPSESPSAYIEEKSTSTSAPTLSPFEEWSEESQSAAVATLLREKEALIAIFFIV
jgi:hypothetical protein